MTKDDGSVYVKFTPFYRVAKKVKVKYVARKTITQII